MADKYFTYEMTNGSETHLLIANTPSVNSLARDAAAKNRAAVDGFKVKEGTLKEHANPIVREAYVDEYRKAKGKPAGATPAEKSALAEKIFGKIDTEALKAAIGVPGEAEDDE